MWVVVVLAVLAGGWYFFMQPQGTGVPVDTTPSSNIGLNGSPDQTNTGQPAISPVLTVVSDAKLGDYLVAANGMALYLYTKDATGVSNCSGECAVNWPPYAPATNEPLVAANGVTGALATITRADGSAQLTYKGAPLYFWKSDTKPGDTTGQNVGGVWFVVKP